MHAQYIQCKPDGKVTKEGIRQIFERLDNKFTTEVEKRVLRSSLNKNRKADNDVSEVYSPPRVIEVVEATGLRPGWALDLTVNKEDGTPWDLSTKENRDAARKLQEEQAPER